MLFNSIDFAVFLPIVFGIYWTLNNKTNYQNLFLLISSYIFYGWWDWRFLILIFASSIVDFKLGEKISISKKKNHKKMYLLSSLFFNLGLLGFFKYYNFFIENFKDAFLFFGHSLNSSTLNIILPVGISFYTFQTLSYTIDIYNKKISPSYNFISFAAFVSFFPQLVAGPIERASNLLPQFFNKRIFSYDFAVDGMRQILWGFFKKMVIADNCAIYANQIFGNYENLNSSTLVLGALFFTFQIYGDFSGYSDIAIGTSKLFGFNLKQNFAFPYFSRDIAEFWRRWHISLSTWFRDYLYIPIGGSRGNIINKTRNIFIIFIVSGFWHGANWTFILWGIVNALYFLPIMLSGKNRDNLNSISTEKFFPSLRETLQILKTFTLSIFAWIIFRSETINDAIGYIFKIFTEDVLSFPEFYSMNDALNTIYLIIIMLIFEWFGRQDKHTLESLKNQNTTFRYTTYIFILILIAEFSGKQQEFIYFQF